MEHPIALLTTDQVTALEFSAVRAGTSVTTLMANAGQAAADVIMCQYEKQPVLVLCGPGNNGGDGFALAKKLKDNLWPVAVASFDVDQGQASDAAQAHRQAWQIASLPLDPSILKEFSLIVDGLFGTGLTRPLGSPYTEMIEAINHLKLPVVSIDLPSGINSDSGEIMGAALQASITITFGYQKPGHVLYPGRSHAGEVIIKDIGLGPYPNPSYFINHPKLWLSHFPIPTPADHKYTRGHGVVFGGDEYTGATQLASKAALRVGAGLVTIACSEKAHPIYACSSANLLTKILRNPKEYEGFLADPRKNAFLIGPGLEPNAHTKKLVYQVLELQRATVLDAGALRAFESNPQELFRLCHNNVVLTPHEGEFTSLFEHKGSKLERALAAAKESHCVVVLKGPDTVIASPDGRAYIQNNAPPCLATAGTGDVLSGLILGYLAQGVEPFHAAAMATWIQARCAEEFGFGLTAEDLLSQLPAVLKSLWRLAR